MIAISDEKALFLLQFTDHKGLESDIERIKKKTGSEIISGGTAAIDSIQQELELYFAGKTKAFKTALRLLCTPFQTSVWKELQRIPHGETRSYGELAKAIGNPTGYRAVAQANGANNFVIIVPCHRVINADGKLGGYSSGLQRKEWLLAHEKK
ncbi:MAG: methylated-DNA--[protein]-cysteine S-methyltransferase [Verrucomicrobia bacterium]|nr:methylated-DNA--[protein]-cysteine S-methyltransferase [Verrucomicrobiota bacterium]